MVMLVRGTVVAARYCCDVFRVDTTMTVFLLGSKVWDGSDGMVSNALWGWFRRRGFLQSPRGRGRAAAVPHNNVTNCILFPVVRKQLQNSCQPIENRMLFEWVQPGDFTGSRRLLSRRSVAKVPNEFQSKISSCQFRSKQSYDCGCN